MATDPLPDAFAAPPKADDPDPLDVAVKPTAVALVVLAYVFVPRAVE
jgi:hypothetical protein